MKHILVIGLFTMLAASFGGGVASAQYVSSEEYRFKASVNRKLKSYEKWADSIGDRKGSLNKKQYLKLMIMLGRAASRSDYVRSGANIRNLDNAVIELRKAAKALD